VKSISTISHNLFPVIDDLCKRVTQESLTKKLMDMKRLKLFVVYTFLLVCACFAKISAQQIFKTTPASVISYYEYVPADYNTNSNKYPVVIFLHGNGEKGPDTKDIATLKANIADVATHGPPKYVRNGTKFPFILISPQLKVNNKLWPVSYIMEVINHVKTYLRIDERKIYITGLSLGGGGAWITAEAYPKLFAAVAPICGGYNHTTKAVELAKESLPVWGFHGNKDTVVPYLRTVNMVNAINASTPVPSPLAKLTIYPGVGHDSWSLAYKNDHTVHPQTVYEWLLSFTNISNNGNKIPVANAGADQTKLFSLTTTATMFGSAADTDGGIKAYAWTKLSGPTATLAGATTQTLKVSSLVKGTYVFRLKVTDSVGNTDSDYMKLTVN
jgi:dienelactone hydrolase